MDTSKKHNAKAISRGKVNTCQKPKFRCLIIVCQMLEDDENGDNEMVDMGKAINSWARYKDTANRITLVGAGEAFFKTLDEAFAKNPYEEVIICGHSIFHNLDNRQIEPLSKRHVGDLKINALVRLLDRLVRLGVKDIMFAACEVAMNQSYKNGKGSAANSDLNFFAANEICRKVKAEDHDVSTLEVVCGEFFLHCMGDEVLCELVRNVASPVCISGLIGVGFIVAEIEVFNTFDQNHLEMARNSKGSNQSVVTNICAKKPYPDVKCFKLCPAQRYSGEEWDFKFFLEKARDEQRVVDVWCDLVLEYGLTAKDSELVRCVFALLEVELNTEECEKLISLAKEKNIVALDERFKKLFPEEKD